MDIYINATYPQINPPLRYKHTKRVFTCVLSLCHYEILILLKICADL